MTDLMTIDRQEYEAMRARLQELEDIVQLRQVDASLATGDTEVVPIETAERLILGEPPVLVWREYRGLTREALSRAAGLPEMTIAAAEQDPGCLSLADAARLARGLAVDIEDLESASLE